MTQTKLIVNIADVPLTEHGNGRQFAVKWCRAARCLG